jgi:parallel beta-helix repeat protein
MKKLLGVKVVLLVIGAVWFIGVGASVAYAANITDDVTGGDCARATNPIGTWDVPTKTCVLTADLNEGIQIDSDNVVLDGNRHTITGIGYILDTGTGVSLSGRTGVTIKNLNIKNFTWGVHLESSNNNVLKNITVLDHGYAGIQLYYSDNNALAGNVTNSPYYYTGIEVYISNNNTLADNSVSNVNRGISLGHSNNNTLVGNTMLNNHMGISADTSNDNKIYRNNFINNIYQAYIFSSAGNILNLPAPIGGNYWDSYDGSSEGCNNVNGDSFCDVSYVLPYVLDSGQDNLPWVKKDGWLDSIPVLPPQPPTPPSKPLLTTTITSITPYSPIAPSQNLISSIHIEWETTASNLDIKTIWRKVYGEEGDWVLVGQGQPNSFNDLNIGSGTYSYKVNACSDVQYLNVCSLVSCGHNDGNVVVVPSSCGPDSNIMTTTLKMGGGSDTVPPSIPVNLNVWHENFYRDFLSWTPSTDNIGVIGYHIYKNGQYSHSVSGSLADGNPNLLTLNSLTTPLIYTVAAYDKAGNISGLSQPFTHNNNLLSINHPPVASNTSVTTEKNVVLPIVLSATDSDVPVQTLTYSIVSGPAHGTLGTISGNQVTYTPATDYVGNDSFTFKANDGIVDSNVGVVMIVVNNIIPVPSNALPLSFFDSGQFKDGVDPNYGIKDNTPITFKVIYTDQNGGAPQNVTLHVKGTWAWADGLVLTMNHDQGGQGGSLYDGYYENGEVYSYTMTLPNDLYTYYFTANNVLGVEVQKLESPANNFLVVGTDGSGYLPNPNGYKFSNKPILDPPLVVKEALFSDVFDKTNLGQKAVEAWLKDDTNGAFFGTTGTCFGLTLSSAKEFNGITQYLQNGQTLYSDIDEPNIPMFHLIRWDGDVAYSNPVLRHIVEDQLSQAAEDVPWLWAEALFIENMNPTDFVLGISNGEGDKREGHAVLPYRVETIVPKYSYKVYVYDPFYPGVDDLTVDFDKVDGGWKRTYGPLGWTSSSTKDTLLAPVASLNYSVHKLSIAKSVKISGAASAILQDYLGRQSGYVNGIEYNEIPGITIFTPFEKTLEGNGLPQIEFRGNIDQDLHLQIVPSSESGGKVDVLKWGSDGYVDFDLKNNISGANLYMSQGNNVITVDSSVGQYNLEVDNVENGQDNVISVSATTTNDVSVQTYSIDWNSSSGGNTLFRFDNDIDGDGVVDFSKEVTNSTFSDITAPTTVSSISGTLGTNDWYTSSTTVALNTVDNDGGVGVRETKYSIDNGEWMTYATTSPITITTDGIHTIQYYSTDWFGNQEATSTIAVKVDTTKPEVNVTLPTNGGEYLLRQGAVGSWSASDSLSGLLSATGTTANGVAIDTSSVGTKTYTVTAIDKAGNPTTKTITYYVRYSYGGILQPVDIDGASIFKFGSTVPLKFQLKDSNGTIITSAVATLSLVKKADSVLGTDAEAVVTSNANTGNLFRYSTDGSQYIYNLSTKTLSTGTWKARITLDDGTTKEVEFSLK